MRVLLINPPTDNLIVTSRPQVGKKISHIKYPPLGLLYVAGNLQKYTNHQIRVMDCQAEDYSYAQIKFYIQDYKPDIVGITVLTFTLIDSLKVAEIVKNYNNACSVIFGGPHPTIYPEETVAKPNVDFVIIGEGEKSFTDLVKAIEKKDKYDNISGLYFIKGNKIIGNKNFGFINDLNELPFPARELTDIKNYKSVLSMNNNLTSIITSRGCPYKCIFCDRPALGKKFRCRSVDDILREIQECLDLGISEFMFYDDTFTIDRKRVIKLCDRFIDEKLDIKWNIRARINTVDKEMLEKLYQAGCNRINYGVESGNEKILKILKKEIDLNQALKIFKMTRKVGLETVAYFMIGNPYETEKEIFDTIEFSKKLNPDYVHFSITTPFPSTALYKMGLENGVYKNDYWKEFAEKPVSDFVPFYWEENLSKSRLLELLKLADREFYFRIKFIIKKLLKKSFYNNFYDKLKIAYKLFFQ